MSETNEHLQSDEDVEAILRLAVRGSSTTGEHLRERLVSAANELGISPEQLSAAEKRYRSEIVGERERQISKEDDERLWKEFRRTQMHDFYSHFGVYAAVNIGLFAFDGIPDGRINWAYWPLFGWGIAIIIQLFTLLAGYSGDNRKEFEKWKRKRLRTVSLPTGEYQRRERVQEDLKELVEEMVTNGQKIEAIKFVREETGWGLSKSKKFVDSVEMGFEVGDIDDDDD